MLDAMVLQGQDGFAQWRHMLSGVYEVEQIDPSEPFLAKVRSTHLDKLILTFSVATRQIYRRTQDHINRTGVDHWLVLYCLTGAVDSLSAGQTMQVRPGDIILRDMGRPVTSHAEASEVITLLIPKSMLDLAECRELGARIAADDPLAHLLGNHLRTLLQQAPALASTAAAAMADATMGLVRACFVTAIQQQSDLPAPTAPLAMQVTHYIQDNLHDADLGPEMIAQHFRLSRTSLYKLCEPLGGVANYIQGQRLLRCYHEICKPGGDPKRISTIAFDWGFSSEAHFSRSFRRAFGLSPRDARTLGQSQLQTAMDPDHPARVIDAWIRTLRRQ